MSSQNVMRVILSSPKTVFTLQALMVMTGSSDRRSLVESLCYYKKKGLIISPRSGIYAKRGYNPEELAGSVFSFSYISLQYVLAKAGVVFQYSDKITCVAEVNRELNIDGRLFQYRRISPVIWIGMKGIEQREGYLMATPERAFLDSLYLFPVLRYFDNVSILDKDKVMEYAEDYKNIALIKRVKEVLQNG